MPYVNQETRSKLSLAKIALIEGILDLPEQDRDGAVNYCMTEIVTRSLKPDGGWRYRDLQRALGLFYAAAHEFYRRLVAPYEDKCIAKNGDIPEYKVGA
jgi:hypothetical protein